ncbi:MAG TPA: YihY family inner membrane protein [Candidatus Cybelea sp.]|nr:YihY family inner membrane protein [Candidatus Cybelea sp.]
MAENADLRRIRLAAEAAARAFAERTSKATPSFLRYLLARFQADGCTSVAAALSYTSLLAIVPLLAIGLAMFAAFPFFADLRADLIRALFQNLAPSLGTTVQEYLDTFIKNAANATGAGIIGLAVTAILLLHTIQITFDRIFGSTSQRTRWSRFPVYWALITLGPILFGVSFSISTYFFQAAGNVELYGLSTGVRLLATVLPFALEATGFALIYRLMPSRPVANPDAIWGGLSAAFLFELLKRLFGLYLQTMGAYQALYGALATIPIFLLWMYLAWVITLLGAEITAALPEWRAGRRGTAPYQKRGDLLSLALATLMTLEQARAHGTGLRTFRLMKDLQADPVTLHGLLETLKGAKILAVDDGGRWLLARDLATITIHQLCRILGLGISAAQPGRDPRVAPLIARLEEDERAMLSQSVGAALASIAKPAEPGATVPETTEKSR